jgi:ketosteroid isomerase-like protein
MEAINTADIERLLSYESDEICYYPPNQPSFSGKENLRNWLVSYFNYFSPSESLILTNFDVYDDFAYLVGTYSVQGKRRQSGDEFNDKGKFINFFKRQSDGNWLCTRSIWNSDNKTFDIHSQILDDFSGTWKLDLSKSIIYSVINSSKLIITQKGNNLNIERTDEKNNKELVKSSFNYTIGNEEEIKSKSGILTITSSYSSGKQTFTIQEKLLSEKNGSKQELKRITNYTLYAKGEILNIITDVTSQEGSSTPKGTGHTELVYTKE